MAYSPQQLAHRLFDERLDRDDALQRCYDDFNETLDDYETHFRTRAKKGKVSGLRIPMTALTAAPGSGKTYFIDELGELREEDIAKFCAAQSEERREEFKSALVLKVSYNGHSGVASVEEDTGTLGLCARILFEYPISVIFSIQRQLPSRRFVGCADIFTRLLARAIPDFSNGAESSSINHPSIWTIASNSSRITF
jgi:hypothetical protein